VSKKQVKMAFLTLWVKSLYACWYELCNGIYQWIGLDESFRMVYLAKHTGRLSRYKSRKTGKKGEKTWKWRFLDLTIIEIFICFYMYFEVLIPKKLVPSQDYAPFLSYSWKTQIFIFSLYWPTLIEIALCVLIRVM
jgi:hypothetical protein